tara:strand:- start:24143 stop:24496 length:354 start_codon:yes stop_codon:yes gene_type:complete
MSNDEQRIRELAYQMWESEGRPEGKTEEHWALARQKLESETGGEMAAPEPKAKRSRMAPGKPPEKASTKPEPSNVSAKTAVDETPALLKKPRSRKATNDEGSSKTAAPRKTRKQLDQ